MGREYKINFTLPAGYNPAALFKKLPSPIDRAKGREIYNYSIETDGFYFVDHLVNNEIAAIALRIFLDEALSNSEAVEIVEP